MRAIDADALHKRIKAKNTSNAMMRVMKAECLAEIDDAPTIEPERKTGKWIPCSERLPELDEDGYSDKVLVCFANFTGCEICEYRDCDDCHGWYVGDTDDNPEDIGIHVVAWMPLPEPYKEGEQNED